MPDNKPTGGFNPPSPLDWNASGWASTGAIRLRTGWFGFAVAEEQVQYSDGSRRWQRIKYPTQIKERMEAANA